MVRSVDELNLHTSTVVCGCGGGDAIHALLPNALSSSAQLVLDADALNAIARDTSLQRLLKNRHTRNKPTVLTPHPLEAARLLSCQVKDIQRNRLHAAQQLADAFQCVVALKGSGSIIASAGHTPVVNGSGNARLATAGTGDVLAGMIGARLAQGDTAWQAATHAVFWHGQAADQWPPEQPLIADRLATLSPGRRTASGSP